MGKEDSKTHTPEEVVQEIRRRTRRRFSAEERIRIVLEGLRGEVWLGLSLRAPPGAADTEGVRPG